MRFHKTANLDRYFYRIPRTGTLSRTACEKIANSHKDAVIARINRSIEKQLHPPYQVVPFPMTSKSGPHFEFRLNLAQNVQFTQLSGSDTIYLHANNKVVTPYVRL